MNKHLIQKFCFEFKSYTCDYKFKLVTWKSVLIVYDNEYTSFIDIYFYEYFHLSTWAPNLFRHSVQHFR